MLFRKITETIENELKTNNDSILVVEGAKQVGKSTTIGDIGERLCELSKDLSASNEVCYLSLALRLLI